MKYASVFVGAALIITFSGALIASAHGHSNSNGQQQNHGNLGQRHGGSSSHGSGSGSNGGSQPSPVPTPPVTPPTTPPVVSGNELVLTNVFTTGYANADNTPAGSDETDLGGHVGITGGTGTYSNPTTVAVGGSIINGKEIDDFPYGTMFYVPNLRKYFIAEDFCGDGNSPQTQPCHNLATAPKGATLWIDLFVGGGSANEDNCESDITGLNTVIENPKSTYAVVAGDVCSSSQVPQTQYGQAVVTQ